MAGLPPGDPQLVSMIVSHLKTQGLFDQFRRDCLADVDTKPAYLNLKQRVDNFVSNHLSNHTWSPHLNKNQLRNNIRQLVLQSGMLEQGVDRIVAQVVDPKINHIFRPQVERVAREFLSPGSCSEEPPAPPPPTEPKPESSTIEQVTSSTPATTSASDAMSILDTITTLNQEASVRASSSTEKVRKGQTSDEPSQLQLEEGVQDMKVVEEGDSSSSSDRKTEEGVQELTSEVKMEESQDQLDLGRESLAEEVKLEEEKSGGQEPIEEDKDKAVGKPAGKPEEEHTDDMLKSACQAKQKAKERIKEEYFLEDSDLEGLSDITVSSVHTSDLSSLEGQSDDDQQQSDSSEEGELPPDDQDEKEKKQGEEHKPRRKAYVHKPFLYSRYYSDSDDEVTVEERRRSAAKDKEERLLKRQKNRERMEEQHKQRSVWTEDQDYKKQKGGICFGQEHPKAKQARKERKVLEKKMALNRKRKLGSKKEEDLVKKKVDTDGSRKDAEGSRKDAEGSRKDSEGSRKDAEGSRKDAEGSRKDVEGPKKDVEGPKKDAEGSKKVEVKPAFPKFPQPKLGRNLSESGSSDERHRRTSGSFSEDLSEAKKLSDKSRTHSFILDLEQGSQEALKQRSVGKFDRLFRKEHPKERKERSLSDERTKLKQKQEKKYEVQPDESQQREGTVKMSCEEKVEKKLKIKSEKKIPGKATVSEEERSDVDPGTDGSKKKEKHSKEALKRSRSHTEDKQGDKPKSKDSEKEKTKGDQDGQKIIKPSSDSDKDQKRIKLSEKRILEKSKLKSKDDTKPQLSKMDNKVQVSEVKSAGGPTVSKPEKKKEGNTKEQRKVFEESLNEKAELSGPKKKAEKKEKSQERRSDSQEERRAPREEKPEKAGKSKTDVEEDLKKVSVLRDASTESDAVATTVATSFLEDTCDALSDITPEPPEGDTESRLRELPAVPAEADALLTLMDVCTSAEARLPPESSREDVTSDLTLQEADMKMKEAALTLLSMDSAVTTSLICHNAREEVELYHREPEVVESTSAKAEQRPADVLATGETKPVESQQTVEVGAENTNKPGLPEHVQEEDKPSESITQPDEPTSNEREAVLNEGEAKDVEIPPESQLRDETAAAEWQEAADTVGSETTEVSTDQISPAESEPTTETSSQKEQPETEIADPRSNPGTESSVFGKQTEIDIDNSEAERKEPETETPEVELVPETNEENRERGPDNHSEQVKQTNLDDVSSTDNQEDKDLSEKEETRDGGGGRKRKLSAHKAEKESGDEGEKEDTKDEQVN
ncbi:hypothetical protein fugu_013542 [Takifugu bimaculatus]|uniref:BOD1/SHG1 domain-containing protein n=1 Tax=Takifugu bimaculatus TaxID=433685 RepID=A0A4Z2C4N1_9TELE|nr:hypothetical protein fugu_013542 [Takifugu bimaculatus]